MSQNLFENDFHVMTQYALDNVSEIVFWTDEEGNFKHVNRAMCELLGYSREELLNMRVPDIDPEVTPESHRELLSQLELNSEVVVQTRPARKDGSTNVFEFTVKRHVHEGRVYLCTFGHEIDLEKPARQRVLASIAAGEPLERTLRLVVELAEKTRLGMIGSILLLDESGHLHHAASTQLSKKYCDAFDGLQPGPKFGSCGKAVHRNQGVMVSDIANDSMWEDFQTLAASEGLKACWSTPIHSSRGAVLGTMAMYFKKVIAPQQTDRELMNCFALLAGIAIERGLEQQRIRKNGIRYQTLVKATSATVWTTSNDGGFVVPQESWEEYTGQPWEQHQGIGWVEMVHEQDRNRLADTWSAAMKSHSTYKSHGRMWHAESSAYRYFEVYGVPVVVDGEIVEWVGCTIDVHDQKTAEIALHKSEHQLRAITDTVPVFISRIDRNYRYLFTNGTYAEYFGLTADEVQQMTVRDLLGESQFQRVKIHIDKALSGQPVTYEVRKRSGKNGRITTFEGSFVPEFNAEGVVVGVYGLHIDITNRRALEKESLNAGALEQRRIGQDLHDGIGQELTGLGMIADTMLLALDQNESKEIYIAKKLASGIKRTLQQVKLMARGLNPVDISSNGIRSALLEMASHVEELYGIGCEVDCDPDLSIGNDQVATNFFRIAQEATTNAAKHSCAGTVKIRLKKTKSRVTLSILDDGFGFVQSETISRGMGLRTMKYRAGVVGATFEIDSEESIGTEVRCEVSLKILEANENSITTGQIGITLEPQPADETTKAGR